VIRGDPIDAVTLSDGRRTHAALTLLTCVGLALLLPSAGHAMPAPGDTNPAEAVVSESTGAAQFRVAIQAPPGPGGLTPQLALTYSSRQAGDGPYGVGWSLNLGEIRCSARFGVPNYANCPQYELDGQLLKPGAQPYRYHTFESFERIIHTYNGGVDFWDVTSTDGSIRTYGGTTESKVTVTTPSGTRVARWLLSAIQDPFAKAE
jgi:hypothetical protein